VRLHWARELSVKIVIDSDTHSVEQLRFTRYGVNQGRVEEPHVLNTLQLAPLHPLAEQRQKV
jgi:histidinol phosphatase-like PHP family hydrolase